MKLQWQINQRTPSGATKSWCLVSVDPSNLNHPHLKPRQLIAIITYEPETEDEHESWRVDKPKAAPPHRFGQLWQAKQFCVFAVGDPAIGEQIK